MEVDTQIKKCKQSIKLTQEELVEKIYATQQTISNWKNGKNYPDMNSLIMLCNLFNISLDILVKGDIIEMKKQVVQNDVRKFKRDTVIFTVLLISAIGYYLMAYHCRDYDILFHSFKQTKKKQ